MNVFILIIITILISSPAMAEEVAVPLSPAQQAAQAEEQARINALTPLNEPKPDWMTYKDPYVDKLDLAKPHRSNDEIKQWMQKTITDLFYLTPTTYKNQLTTIKSYFEKPSWIIYAKHLKDSQYLDLVAKQGYSTEAIIRSAPEIIESMPRHNAYHWTIKTQVTTSVLTTGNSKQAINATNYTVYTDIKRVEKSADDMNLIISEIRFDKPLAAQY